jgi:hypothetical protein
MRITHPPGYDGNYFRSEIIFAQELIGKQAYRPESNHKLW